MYQLRYNNSIIYDPRGANNIDKLYIREPSAHLAVSEAGSTSFVLEHDHPLINSLQRMSGVVELLEDSVPIFRGRIWRDATDFYLNKTIECEGVLACLNDSVVEPFVFPDDFANDSDYLTAVESGNVVEFFLRWLFDNHNSQVGEEQQLHLGTVTVKDPNNYLSRSSDSYASTWSVISSKLFGSALGGYLLIRYEPDGNYVDYVEDLLLTNVQTVALAENLLDITNEVDASELYSAILPLGKDKLTIAELSDGDLTADLVKEGKVIYSRSKVAAFGRITSIQTWDDVTEPINLQTKSAQALASNAMPETISCKACDLHCADNSIPSLRVGRYTRLTSPVHGYSGLYPLMSMDIDILNPGNTPIEFGKIGKTLTSSIEDENAATVSIREITMQYYLSSSDADQFDGEWVNALPEVTEGTYLWTRTKVTYSNDSVSYTAPACTSKATTQIMQPGLSEITQTTSAQIAHIVESTNSILLEALKAYTATSDFEEYKNTVASQLAVLADEVFINLSNVTEQITNINGDLQMKYEEITKAYRFTPDGLIIGESGNEVLIRIDNDILEILRNNYPALWFDEHGGHMDNLHVKAIYIGHKCVIQAESSGKVTIKGV